MQTAQHHSQLKELGEHYHPFSHMAERMIIACFIINLKVIASLRYYITINFSFTHRKNSGNYICSVVGRIDATDPKQGKILHYLQNTKNFKK